MSDVRPDPDALLARVTQEESRARRGRLKVFLGACAGVGKTFAMLEAAQRLRRNGVDVVAGYIQSHGRAETDALLVGLEHLPEQRVEYRGTPVREFDLAAALARRPAVLLVDELAHTNAPGLAHAKRWQDVQDCLAAGISVLTTLNIQHIESQNDLVAQITRVTVQETVPDRVLDDADDVELVDLPPDELLQRFAEGRVYVPDMATRAQEGFFQKGNVIALRQLALRYTAERVDRQMEEYRRARAIVHAWPVAERLLVCVGPSPQSSRVVRAAARMSRRLGADLIAVYVEPPTTSMRAADRERVLQTLHLAEELGAETVTLTGANLTGAVLRYARERNVSKIVIGKPTVRTWRDVLVGSPVDRMVRRSGEVDVYVIKGVDEAPDTREPRPARPGPWGPYGWTMAVVAVCTLIAAGLFPYLNPVNLVMVYLAGVVFVATRFGRGPSTLAAVSSVAVFDFCFIPPYLTFAVSDTEYLLTFGVMLVVGLVVSRLAVRTRQQAESATARERRTAALYSMSRELASTQGPDALVAVIRKHVEDVFGGEAVLWLPGPEARVAPVGAGIAADAEAHGVAQWAFDHQQPAGLGTRTLPGAPAHYVPLAAGTRVTGVLGVTPRDPEPFLAPEPLLLLETFASQAAVALERDRTATQAADAKVQAEAERLRGTLLSSISHDLRTPLAGIQGSASLLLASPDLAPEVRREMVTGIHEEAEYVNRMVKNVLDLTRLETGAVAIQREPHALDELVGAVTALLERHLGTRPLALDVPAGLPLVPVDAALVQQVLYNLLDNALHHTPPGTPIEIGAVADPTAVTITVADRGPGIRPGDERRIFDKFYRTTPEGKRAGMGLGLTLCEAIVRLHGGRIWVDHRPGGGAAFRFTLPLDARA